MPERAGGLGDREYYRFVMSGFQALCQALGWPKALWFSLWGGKGVNRGWSGHPGMIFLQRGVPTVRVNRSRVIS